MDKLHAAQNPLDNVFSFFTHAKTYSPSYSMQGVVQKFDKAQKKRKKNESKWYKTARKVREKYNLKTRKPLTHNEQIMRAVEKDNMRIPILHRLLREGKIRESKIPLRLRTAVKNYEDGISIDMDDQIDETDVVEEDENYDDIEWASGLEKRKRKQTSKKKRNRKRKLKQKQGNNNTISKKKK